MNKDDVFGKVQMVESAAHAAKHRLQLGDRPDLVFDELRAVLARAMGAPDAAAGVGQNTVHMAVTPMDSVVSNEELRVAICDTVNQLKPLPLGWSSPKEVQERLQAHLDLLLKTEAARVCMLIAGADVVDGGTGKA